MDDRQGDYVYFLGTRINEDFQLFAQWEEFLPEHTVTIDLNYPGAPVDRFSVMHGEYTHAPIPGDRPGLQFRYWTTDPAGNYRFDFDNPIIDDIFLYAQWNIVTTPDIHRDVALDLIPRNIYQLRPSYGHEGRYQATLVDGGL